MQCIAITHPSGSSCTIDTLGATIVSWKIADGTEMLYRSPISEEGQPIRGGVPVCFPQFGTAGDFLVKHGVARSSTNWSSSVRQSAAEFTLVLDGDAFPEQPTLTYTVSLDANRLTLTFDVMGPIVFNGALHTYFKAPNGIENVSVSGLGGASATELGDAVVLPEVLKFDGPRDVIVPNAPRALSLNTGTHVVDFGLDEGWTDVVLWNVGADTLKDMPKGDWRGYFCAEAALATREHRVTLGRGETWRGVHSLDVRC
ncbi:MAG: hypothetical protein KVP17_003120 [Porospora cf. gigantea B]|uniref:uncharacterized protein n=1 Tax=Porospora cf. gigantea B TaxID=2853592 RepID=UPI003571B5AC|nr:MAG: hypothetical protein KVP17_003120 [Porospora cf. gigantea B]